MAKNKRLQSLITKLVESSFKNGDVVRHQILRSIQLLKSQDRTEAITSLTEYLKQVKRIQRQHTLYIETAVPLSQDVVSKMKKIVDKRVKITKVVTNINPDILGGFKIKVGDEIWDESLKNKMEQLKDAIIS